MDDSYSGTFSADKTYEYLYEGDEPIQDYLKVGGSYVITNRYVHGASVDERLVHWQYDQNTGAETKEQFYHRDHQGSIVAMSRDTGARADGELYTYDAFGNQVTGATTGQPFRYTGRRYDAETGLYYYRARYYSAELGRFLQSDPIGYEDNMNMYAYVGNDPLNKTDPTGNADLLNTLREFFNVPAGSFNNAVMASIDNTPTDVPSSGPSVWEAAVAETILASTVGMVEAAPQVALIALTEGVAAGPLIAAGRGVQLAKTAQQTTKLMNPRALVGRQEKKRDVWQCSKAPF